MTNIVSPQNSSFTLADGFRPAKNGTLYIGKAGTDPTVTINQITVNGISSDGSISILTQPISLDPMGLPVDGNGKSIELVVETHYSFVVLDGYGKIQQSTSVVEVNEVSNLSSLRTLPVLREGQGVKVLSNGYGDFVGHIGTGTDDNFNIVSGNGFYWERVNIPFFSKKTNASLSRTAQQKMQEIPSILDWDSDSANDDSTRFKKAILANVDNVFIPSITEVGSLKIANIDINKSIRFWGTSITGYRQVGATIVVLDGASYGFNFEGAGNGSSGQPSRLIGGGITGVAIFGETVSNTADLIKVTHCSSLEFSNVLLRQSAGSGFVLQDFMESRIKDCYFIKIGSETKNVIHISDYMTSRPWNVNNLHITGNTFGACGGYYIYASDNSNADLIWVSDNKFEWDENALIPNTTSKSVIYLGKVERFYIENNGFVYYYPAHGNYESILEIGQSAAYGVQFKGNSAWGCTGANYWKVKGGSLLATNNRSNAEMSTVVTSSYSQDIEAPLIRTSTGNRPLSYFPKPFETSFIPSHILTGTNASNNFVQDSDAVLNGTTQEAAAGVEIRRLLIPKDMLVSGRVLKISARVKNLDVSTAAQLQLILDGSIITTATNSTVTTTNYQTIPINSGWTQLDWYITPTLLGSGAGSIIFKNSGTNTFLFDGVSINYAEFLDVVIPWSPGVIAAAGVVSTTITSARLSAFITGVSQPKTNGSLSTADVSTYFNSSDNTLTLKLRTFADNVTIAATAFTVRLFLK